MYQKIAKKGKWDTEKLRSVPNGNDWFYLIDRCLAPNYRERYQSALEVLQDMKPMIGSINPIHNKERLSRNPNISKLIITQGDNLGTTYILSNFLNGHRRMLHVGRKPEDNDIVLPENNSTYVSRYHFTLEKSKDGSFWTIKDGQWIKSERAWVTSTNGTYLNATPVITHSDGKDGLKVFTGDIITVGEYKIKVE